MSTYSTDAPATPSPAAGEPGVRSRPRVALHDAVAVLSTFLFFGVVTGFLWWLLVDPAQFTRAKNGGLAMGEVELGRRFDDDGWFAVIAGVTGLLAGAALTWWRSRDSLLTALLVLAGSVIAAVVMAGLGGLLGPPDPDSVVAAAAVGATIPIQLEVTGFAGYLVWPITAMVGSLLVLWSPAAPGPPVDPVD